MMAEEMTKALTTTKYHLNSNLFACYTLAEITALLSSLAFPVENIVPYPKNSVKVSI